MKQRVTLKGLKTIAIVTMFGVAAVALFKKFGPEGPLRGQTRNLAAAGRHIPVLLPALRKDARFAALELFPFTGGDGCLLVRGTLNSESDLEDLKRLIETSKPPVAVLYGVVVIPSAIAARVGENRRAGAPK
jgi:hypothetical protein